MGDWHKKYRIILNKALEYGFPEKAEIVLLTEARRKQKML